MLTYPRQFLTNLFGYLVEVWDWLNGKIVSVYAHSHMRTHDAHDHAYLIRAIVRILRTYDKHDRAYLI